MLRTAKFVFVFVLFLFVFFQSENTLLNFSSVNSLGGSLNASSAFSYNTLRRHVTSACFGHAVSDIRRSVTYADVLHTCNSRLSVSTTASFHRHTTTGPSGTEQDRHLSSTCCKTNTFEYNRFSYRVPPMKLTAVSLASIAGELYHRC